MAQLGKLLRSTIIICTRFRARELLKLIESIRKQEANSLINRILVIDSSPDNETESLINQQILDSQLPINYFRVPYDFTLPRKRNYALSLLDLSESEVIHFFDDDVELYSDYIDSVRATFEDPMIVGVGGADQNLKERHVHKFLELVGVSSDRQGVILRSGVNTQNISGTIQRETEWLSGCAMSYRASALIGQFFDERRHFDGEDSDFSYRMSKKGKLFWNPKAKFTHESSMAEKVTNNHKVRYHLKHLALSCAEFDGKVQARYCLVYLFFNGLISIAFGIKRFKLAEMKVGIAYFFSSLVFPLVLARYHSKKSIESNFNDSNNNVFEI